MNINELVKLQNDFDSRHEGNFKWNEKITDNNIEMLEFLLISLFGEIGETANLVKKCVRGDFKLSQIEPKLEEEIADIFIYLIKISNQLNIDLEKVYLAKMEKNINRFNHYEKED
jgi:NTP pyrophosphatase (non-canonical NTP hydrolase)